MNRSRRVALIQVACLAVFFLALIFVAGAVLAENAIHAPSNHTLRSASEIVFDPHVTSQDVEVKAPDGAVLRGWLFLPAQAHPNYVMVLHGVGDNRTGMFRVIRMLLKSGYAVLAPDSRAHGESSGALITYGVLEAGDVHLWADFLFHTQAVRNLYGLGESLGAAVLLESLAVEPRFSAVVAESPFSTFDAVAMDRVLQHLGSGSVVARAIARPVVSAGLLYTRMRYGVNLSAAAPIEVVRHTSVPILLIHGLRDSNIYPQHSRDLLLANPRHIVPWFVPKAGHSGAFSADPEVFEERVTSFYRSHEH